MADTSDAATSPQRRGSKGLPRVQADRLEQTFAGFADPSQEWRRLISELLGTLFLVLVAAGGAMMGQALRTTSAGRLPSLPLG